MIIAVTAYVPIPGHPRSADEYHALGEPLHATGDPADPDGRRAGGLLAVSAGCRSITTARTSSRTRSPTIRRRTRLAITLCRRRSPSGWSIAAKFACGAWCAAGCLCLDRLRHFSRSRRDAADHSRFPGARRRANRRSRSPAAGMRTTPIDDRYPVLAVLRRRDGGAARVHRAFDAAMKAEYIRGGCYDATTCRGRSTRWRGSSSITPNCRSGGTRPTTTRHYSPIIRQRSMPTAGKHVSRNCVQPR